MIGGTFIVQAVAPSILLMFVVPPLIAALSIIVFVSLVGDRQLPKDAPKPRLSIRELASAFWGESLVVTRTSLGPGSAARCSSPATGSSRRTRPSTS